jgi:glycosyltransferase involved in cell wall biosynthesis
LPALSIIIATLNAGATLDRCLKSIREQRFQDYEVILADGASCDNTIEVAKSSGIRCIEILSNLDSGIYEAWNRALSLATGDWVTFIGADDFFTDSESVGSLMARAKECTDAPLVYGRLERLTSSGKFVGHSGSPWRSPWGLSQSFLFANFPNPIMGCVYRRSVFGSYQFDQSYRITGDMDWVLRALRDHRGSHPVFVDQPVVAMRSGGLSTNPKYYLVNIWEQYRYRTKNGICIANVGLCIQTMKMFFLYGVRTAIGVPLFNTGWHYYENIKSSVRR